MKEDIAVFWFRRDLRLHDNAGLYYALCSGLPVLPIFIFDKIILDDLEEKSDARVQFIRDTLCNMSKEFEEYESSVRVFYDAPLNAISQLLEEYNIKEVYTNRDYEPYAKQRDQEVETLLKDKGIRLNTFKDQVIFEHQEITTGAGEPYKVFTPYRNSWMEKFDALKLESFPAEEHLDRLAKCKPYEVPSLQDMGFSTSDIEIPQPIFDKPTIKKYDERRNFPAIDGTSRLGIHLRFGTISIRQAVAKGKALNGTWLNELIWREFYMMILSNYPYVVSKAFKPKYDQIPWRNSQEDFENWCQGMTGYPIVDAGMRELNNTGYMHNRVRMIVASFLTKHLLIDWRWGEAYFAKKLLDYELSSNNGGWQWAAGTGTDAQPYFRIFNPYSQTDKFDKDRKYIEKWIPEIESSDYPNPIIDHKEARERALATYKEALA